MKKFFATLLAGLVIVSFTACKPQTGQTSPTDAHIHFHDHIHQEETTAPEASESTAESSEASSENPPQADETNAPLQNEELQLSKGTINGNIYTSDFTGLKFTKPDSFTYLSDDELALKIGVSTQELAPDIFPFTADRVPAVYDMWATDSKDGINISVAYENMHVSASVAMTTDEYMEMLEGAFENTKGTTLVQKSSVDLSGKMYQKAIFTTEAGNTSTQSIYYIRAMGKLMNVVLVTAPANTELPDIEKLFG
ncbi:MAG: hypothetical protein IJD93_05015 [Ruminococcus sp.]|nr:hypothetical protein [Ruminococcus sp.]